MDASPPLNGLHDAALRLHSALRVVPLHAGEPCGDAACHLELHSGAMADSHLLAIVDGLGHGPEAAKAAEAALRVVRAHSELALPELLTEIDVSLAATRGAAIGLVRIQGRRAWHAGVGNTRVLHWRGDRMQRLSSQPGIVGGGLPQRLQVTELDMQPDDWWLLFTDGLDEMLNLPAHLPEWDRDPALLCDHLLAHARAGRDDAGVLVCRAGRF